MTVDQDSTLPDNTTVGVGYSVWALLALLLATCVLVCVPIALSYQKLPGDMVIVGCNSLAISASCHVSPVDNAMANGNLPHDPPGNSRPVLASKFKAVLPPYFTSSSLGVLGNDEIEMNELVRRDSMASRDNEGKMKEGILEKVSQSKIRWGVIKMPADFYEEYDSNEPYGHLGFGVQGEEITPPRYDELYA
jgi:hypothetical protein